MLPLRERRALDRVPDSRDQTVGYLPLAALSSEAEIRARLEVVQILDMRNPTKRLSVPGTETNGVLAKDKFAIGDSVLCYGGLLCLGSIDLESDVYALDCAPLPSRCAFR